MFEIFKNWLKPKKKRSVNLILAHKFKDGTKLYTYNEKDWELLMYMHDYTLQTIMNYHMIFNNDMNTVHNTIKKAKELVRKSITDSKPVDPSALSLLDFLLVANKESLNAKVELREALFNMYFILEEEPEFSFSDVYKDIKLKLLDAEPEVKARFFTMLNPIIENLIKSYSENILAVSSGMKEMKRMERKEPLVEIQMNIEDF